MNYAKLREAVHFVCKKMALQPEKLGAVKLQKIIWYFDVKSYVITGNTATGAQFVKGQFGPYSRELAPVIQELAQAGRLYTDAEEFFDNAKTRFIGKGETDLSLFSDKERSWLEQISSEICDNHTADSISERSHDAIWQMAQFGETIPFAATVVRLRKPSAKGVEQIRKELGLA